MLDIKRERDEMLVFGSWYILFYCTRCSVGYGMEWSAVVQPEQNIKLLISTSFHF